MNIKPIRTEEDYKEALKELEGIFHAELDTEEGKMAEILSILIEDYENKHYQIDPPIENDWTFDYIYDLVKNACQMETRGTLSDRGLKLTEEVGELAAEILKLSGFKWSNDTEEEIKEKILKESVDSLIMVLHIMVDLGFTRQQIVEMTERQINKWLNGIK